MIHRSVITGTMATKHHTRWLNAMDDSLERYLHGTSQDINTDTPEELTDTLAAK
jgi:trimethylamine monooxygenase